MHNTILCLVLGVMQGSGGTTEVPDALGPAFTALGLEASMVTSDASIKEQDLISLPGWMEVRGHQAATQHGLRVTMRAFPEMSGSWPTIGEESRGVAESAWNERVRQARIDWGTEIRVQPRTLDLHATPDSLLAWGEVYLSRRDPSADPARVTVRMGCGFTVEESQPILVGASPVRCRVTFDTSSSATPELLFLPIECPGAQVTWVPIRWTGPRPTQASLEPVNLPLAIGQTGRALCVSTNDAPIMVTLPLEQAGRRISLHALSSWQYEIEVELTSTGGRGAVPLSIQGSRGEEEHRFFVVPPWPPILPEGQEVVGCSGLPGERLLVIRRPSDQGLMAVFPDRFAEIEELLDEAAILGEERTPTTLKGSMMLVRRNYALSLFVDEAKATALPRWAKEWK